MRTLGKSIWRLIALCAILSVPGRDVSNAGRDRVIPPDFQQDLESTGATLYRKDYQGGSTVRPVRDRCRRRGCGKQQVEGEAGPGGRIRKLSTLSASGTVLYRQRRDDRIRRAPNLDAFRPSA